jgi:hypothetical protein
VHVVEDQIFLKYIRAVRTHYISLGSFILKLVTNRPDDYFGTYFSRSQYLAEPCMDMQADAVIYAMEHELLPKELIDRESEEWRSGVMRKGYYTAHYFGSPVVMIRRGMTWYLFGQQLDMVIWRYNLKMLLTVLCQEHNKLHLKSTAFQIGEHGYLLISPGGEGKTTFMHSMMELGAVFVSNTHSIIGENGWVEGVHSNMRFRGMHEPGLDRSNRKSLDDEMNLDPQNLYPERQIKNTMKLSSVLFISKNAEGRLNIKKLDESAAYDGMNCFGAPIQTYNIKQDLYEYCGRDYQSFSDLASGISNRVRSLIRSVPSYWIEVDSLHNEKRVNIYNLLKNGLKEMGEMAGGQSSMAQ